MSYFKKFCDLIGGIGAFFATVFVFGCYMEYDPKTIAEGESKLRMFFSNESPKEYRHYLIFIGLLVLAVILGRVFKHLPAVTLPVSMLPLCQIMGMLWRDTIYSSGYFYVMVSIVVVVGNIYELCSCDDEGGRQALVGVSVVGGLGVVGALLSAKFSSMATAMSQKFIESELSEPEMLLEKRFSLLGIDLLSDVPEGEVDALIFMAGALAVAVALSLLLRNFCMPLLDVFWASIPVLAVFINLHGEKLNTSPMIALVPIAVYFFTRIALFSKKDKDNEQI